MARVEKQMGVKYLLVCPQGFGYHGYQHCSIRKEFEGKPTNVSRAIVELWNAALEVDDEPLILEEGGAGFFVLSGESFTIEDLAEAINDRLFYGEADIEIHEGGEETTLKVAGEKFECPCGSDKFYAREDGCYLCTICGAGYKNKPPLEE